MLIPSLWLVIPNPGSHPDPGKCSRQEAHTKEIKEQQPRKLEEKHLVHLEILREFRETFPFPVEVFYKRIQPQSTTVWLQL